VRVCARRVSLRLGRLGEAGLQLLLDEMRWGAVIMLCEMTFTCTYFIPGQSRLDSGGAWKNCNVSYSLAKLTF
jgi:hypothetical protein